MLLDTIVTFIKEGDSAAILRACLDLLKELHPDNPTRAQMQYANLRAQIQFADGTQIPMAYVAAAAYDLLSNGMSVVTLMTVPEIDFLVRAEELERQHSSSACNMTYTRHKCSNFSTYQDENMQTSERGGDDDRPASFREYVTCQGLAHLEPKGYSPYCHLMDDQERGKNKS